MQAVTGDGPPRKIPVPPRIFTNSPENMLRSLERLARWTLKKDVTPEQVVKVRAVSGVLRLRIDMERILLDRERFDRDMRLEEKLDAVLDAITEGKEAGR